MRRIRSEAVARSPHESRPPPISALNASSARRNAANTRGLIVPIAACAIPLNVSPRPNSLPNPVCISSNAGLALASIRPSMCRHGVEVNCCARPTIPPLASPGTLPAYLDRPSIGAWPRPALFISWLTRRTAETPPRLPIRFQKSMNPAPRPLTTSGTSTPSPERMPMIRSSRFDGW